MEQAIAEGVTRHLTATRLIYSFVQYSGLHFAEGEYLLYSLFATTLGNELCNVIVNGIDVEIRIYLLL